MFISFFLLIGDCDIPNDVDQVFPLLQIERRLNAVGKDISIMVQPVEFIDKLKKDLKAVYKNYKDFVVE